MTSSNYHLKAPLHNTTVLSLEIQHVNVRGGAHKHLFMLLSIQSVNSIACLIVNLEICRQTLPRESTWHLLAECLLWRWHWGNCGLAVPLCPWLCRSRGGWHGGNHHAQILPVWRHRERGIQKGKRQFVWVLFTALCKHELAVPLVPYL